MFTLRVFMKGIVPIILVLAILGCRRDSVPSWRFEKESGDVVTGLMTDQDWPLLPMTNQWTGKLRGYWADGSLQLTTSFSNGVEHGTSILWHPNGAKALQVQYRNGERHGSFYQWHENGEIRVEGHYEHGQKTGVWIFRNKIGDIIDKGESRKSGAIPQNSRLEPDDESVD